MAKDSNNNSGWKRWQVYLALFALVFMLAKDVFGYRIQMAIFGASSEEKISALERGFEHLETDHRELFVRKDVLEPQLRAIDDKMAEHAVQHKQITTILNAILFEQRKTSGQ